MAEVSGKGTDDGGMVIPHAPPRPRARKGGPLGPKAMRHRLWMRARKLREAKQCSQGHTAKKMLVPEPELV